MADANDDPALKKVQTALQRGDLKAGDLSARRLAGVLGQTTSVIYHRWGSVDGLLFAVATVGWTDLASRLQADKSDGAKKLAESYVAFGLDHAALYRLMTDHVYDRDALRASGVLAKRPSALPVAKILLASFQKRGSEEAETDASLLLAGLHGLVTFSTEREATLKAARRLARKLA